MKSRKADIDSVIARYMMRGCLTWALLLAAYCSIHAQSMELLGGNMSIAAGTRIAISGPVTWNLAEGAQVVNDGRILLGEEASLVESDGTPIIGAGTEETVLDQAGAITSYDAGGLGLSISAAGLGNTTVVRGHLPLDNNGTDQSIARWYRLEPAPAEGNELDLVLRYAASELNGHNGNTLALYIGAGPEGPWSLMPSTPVGISRTVSTFWSGPWASTITAFPQDISTLVHELAREANVEYWPNPTADLLWVRSTIGEPIKTLELLDLSGRSVMYQNVESSSELSSLSLQALPGGIYLLRVNGTQAARIVKQ